MVYATNSQSIKRGLNGIHTCIQATDYSEANYEEILSKASKFEREQVLKLNS